MDMECPPEIHLRNLLKRVVAEQVCFSAQARESLVKTLRDKVLGQSHNKLVFPEKLHQLLSCELLSPYLFWLEDGMRFVVEREGYTKYVMAVFFSETRFKSFQNMMSTYGFHKVGAFSSDNQVGSPQCSVFIVYSHDQFIKSDFELCQQITRVRTSHHAENGLTESTENGQESLRDPFLDALSMIFELEGGPSFDESVEDLLDEDIMESNKEAVEARQGMN